jgi:hypothetical protein
VIPMVEWPREGFGYLTVNPDGTTTVNASNINWTTNNQVLANSGLVPVSTDRKVTVVAGGGPNARTHFLIDVVGYCL